MSAPGPLLIDLISREIGPILKRESEQSPCLHLYRTGDYWMAFERSAYKLLKLFPEAETVPMAVQGLGEPIVAAGVRDEKLAVVLRKYQYTAPGLGQRIYTVGEVPAGAYRLWHRRETAGLV